jgi:hypothetical protein
MDTHINLGILTAHLCDRWKPWTWDHHGARRDGAECPQILESLHRRVTHADIVGVEDDKTSMIGIA